MNVRVTLGAGVGVCVDVGVDVDKVLALGRMAVRQADVTGAALATVDPGRLSAQVPSFRSGVEVVLKPGKGHRFVAVPLAEPK